MKSDARYGSAKLQPGSNRKDYHHDPEKAQQEADRAAMPQRLADALKNVLRYSEANTCQHEETHRGGAIWTICSSCGRKWADDMGGFRPFQEPKEWTEAHATLAAYAAMKEAR